MYEKGRLEVCKFLIDSGADINVQDNEGRTPSHWACSRNHLDQIKSLMENGADVNVKDNDGKIPLHLACEENHLDVVWFLTRQYPLLVLGHSE